MLKFFSSGVKRPSAVQTIEVGGISIVVTWKRIRHAHLRVHRDGRVTMSAPTGVRLRDLEAFAISRLEWIRRQQSRMRHLPTEVSPPIVDAETLARHKAILKELLPPLIAKWEERLKVRLTGYYLRRMKSRWGTCNYRTKYIRLNTELATKPRHLLEYVLVHEMVHLIVPNHGKRFIALMDEHYPSWRQARSELNNRGMSRSGG